MRFPHTADWHLGRTLHGANLLEDQGILLGQIVDLAKRSGVQAVLVAGDVFDRAVPPAEAVALLNETLSDLVLGLGVAVVVVAGNHDSPERLAFGARVLERQQLHMVGALAGSAAPIVFEGRPRAHPRPGRALRRAGARPGARHSPRPPRPCPAFSRPRRAPVRSWSPTPSSPGA